MNAAPLALRRDEPPSRTPARASTATRTVSATHRVDFDVHAGDRFVLLGASGCGKSSLLKAIGGFVTPREGRIKLDGETIVGPGPDRIVVFREFDQLPPWMTVLANVMCSPCSRRDAAASRRRARVRSMRSRRCV